MKKEIILCPKCKSDNLKKRINPQGGTGDWECYNCGYTGDIIIEEEKNIK
jgi:hypothetical protein